ncbi:amidohydrolase family protein [Asticcacaulis taihuensis]|uniref:amidohydrolase family protein n=1 Tax=Asticcacaulis taihuensis TaxID=260084 RepID=UPI003F6936AD
MKPVKRILFKNVRIFDGSGSDLFPGEVLVEGDRITKVSKRPEGLFSKKDPKISEEGAEVIDGGGAVLMPGMVEAHGHLSWPSSTERFVPEFVLPIEEMMLVTAQNARIVLEAGFTSVYSAGALSDRIEVVIRDNINKGYLPGPRLRACTLERSPEEDESKPGSVNHGRGPEAIRAFVRKCKAMGVDQVKLVISGEDALNPGSSHHLMCTEEEAMAAGEAAREVGLPLSAHTQGNEAVKLGLRAGVRVMYHCTYADEEAIDMLVAQKDKIFMAPAIGVIVATLEATPPPHIDMSSMKEMAKPVIERAKKMIPELKKRGVRVLIGGDYGFPFNPNGTNARDLQHFVDLFDYTPKEALVAATKLGGELMELEVGEIRPGFLADILLVNGDVTKDVRILQKKDNLLAIMKGGQFHKNKLPSRQSAVSVPSREEHA